MRKPFEPTDKHAHIYISHLFCQGKTSNQWIIWSELLSFVRSMDWSPETFSAWLKAEVISRNGRMKNVLKIQSVKEIYTRKMPRCFTLIDCFFSYAESDTDTDTDTANKKLSVCHKCCNDLSMEWKRNTKVGGRFWKSNGF